MSNATTRNFGAAQRERARRVGLDLEGSLPIGSLAVTGEPGWDAFFGSLHDKEAAANEAGMGFRADLGSIGRAPKFSGGISEWSNPPQAGDAGGLTPREQASIGANLGLAQLTDYRKAKAEAENRANLDEMQAQYQEHVLNSVSQPKEEGSITTTTEGAGAPGAYAGPFAGGRPNVRAGDAYSIAPTGGPDTRSARQQMLDRLPGAMRARFDPALAPQERADAAQAEAIRHAKETERIAEIAANAKMVDAEGTGGKGPKLSAAAQEDIATMMTIQDLNKSARKIGDEIGWNGVGGMWQGSIGKVLMQQFGKGDPKAEELRNTIGNVQGTIAKLRGGTAFSAQEKKMLDNYTPTIDDDPKAIQAKLKSLDEFIDNKRKNTLRVASGQFDSGGGDGGGGEADPRFSTPVEGAQKGIPGIPGGLAKFTNGKWIRVQ